MKKLHRFLEDYAFTVALNANDTFGYACAEAIDVDIDELPGIIELEEKFGYSGVNAFMAIKSNQDVIPPVRDENYIEAKKYIKQHFLNYQNTWIPKKYVWMDCYTNKGYVIFEGDNPLDKIDDT